MPPGLLDLPPLLDNLERYLQEPDRDAVAQAAVIHAQFELIHPFEDGNGRVGRMPIPLFLFATGTLSAPSFHVGAYLEAQRDSDHARLRALSATHDWQGWTGFFLTAVRVRAEEDTAPARRILDLYGRMKDVLAQATRSQFAIQALDPLFTVPVFSTPQFVELSKAPRASVARMLGELARVRVLVVLREGRGRRARIYGFPALLDIIETEPQAAGAGAETTPQQLPLLPMAET